jgi:hypothetical protein
MIAVSFSQLDGWLALIYLAAVVAVTVRLLRNLDAFSLDDGLEDVPETAGKRPVANDVADGDPS